MLLGRAVQRRGAAVSRSSSFGMAQLRPGSSSLRRSSFSLRYVYGLSAIGWFGLGLRLGLGFQPRQCWPEQRFCLL